MQSESWPRVLVVHNQFQHLGGEDFTAYAEVELMRKRGAHVQLLVYDSNDPERLRRVKRRPDDLVFNRAAYRDVRRIVQRDQIDLVHCHNLWPMIGPSAYWAAMHEGATLVQTVHDFRMGCLQGQLLRRGEICERCRPGWHLDGIRFGCYRGSHVQSVALGVAQTINAMRGVWSLPTLYIAPSRFVHAKLRSWGVSDERIVVKPHFVAEDPGFSYGERDVAVYVGRLSQEKGLQAVIDAWHPDWMPLLIVGDGPLRAQLEQHICQAQKANVRLVGRKTPAEVAALLRRACFLVLPSITYETFGRVLVEAYAHGVPVLASRLGATSEIVEEGRTGLLFNPHDACDLRAKLAHVAVRPEQSAPMRWPARMAFEQWYSAAANAEGLLSAYQRARRMQSSVALGAA
ncbi:MAG: glycosyltransferase family 4 protein [Chloroflexi bacterium]|nr:glycosyltransferase family 4 protein [Chloroflexota bacterium]